MTHPSAPDPNGELLLANSCMALGAGLGAVGTGTALLAGATCPLCIVIAPALVGIGVWKRIAAQRHSRGERAGSSSPPNGNSAD